MSPVNSSRWTSQLRAIFFFCAALTAAEQTDSGWRISPERINIQIREDRALQVLDDVAMERHEAHWTVDAPSLADLREEDGRAVVHAKAAGMVRVTANIGGEKRYQDITIWPGEQALPPGTTHSGMHPIGREIADISAGPTAEGPNMFSLEQTADGKTYLRATRSDGLQVWNWQMPEHTRDVELVCGDWLGGALLSANAADSFTLYTVGGDGKLRWSRKIDGKRKGHAYNREHLVHILRQSADGAVTKVTAIDEQTGTQKFELTIPASTLVYQNAVRNGSKLTCAPSPKPVSSTRRTEVTRLFVNIDGFAYVAFSQNEQTVTASCAAAGLALGPKQVTSTRYDRVVLWQIHPDGTYRSTIFDEARSNRAMEEVIVFGGSDRSDHSGWARRSAHFDAEAAGP